MKALVTGANGFTGSHLVKFLLKCGHEVRGLVRSTSNLESLKDLNIELFYGDLTNCNTFDDAVTGMDVVFHTAAAFRIDGVSKKYFWDVNLEGTRKLLEAAKKNKVKKFVHCSTVGVQGHIKKFPATEEDPYAPGDYYQESKAAGEKLVLEYSKNGLPVAIIRPAGIYGPGDLRFLKLFRFINNGKFKMLGSGNVFYHLTHVEDLVKGLLLAYEKDEALGEIITIGGEEYITLNELVEKIAVILNKSVPKIRIPVSPVWWAGLICEIACKPFGIKPPLYRRRVDFFVKNRAFDISKAKKILGYKPNININEGLRGTANWYRQKGLFILTYIFSHLSYF